MRWIYLSPHPDDAALCAGGLIYDQTRSGMQVEIWTLMAGVAGDERLSEFALKMHARWSTGTMKDTVEMRRREDLHAGEILGARVLHFGFLDAIYRRGFDGRSLYADPVGTQVHQGDASLPRQIADALRSGLRPDDRAVCLLGIGDHVDHVLVRQAAEALGRALVYVADFPYVLKHPESVGAKTQGLGPWQQRISKAGLTAWIEAVEAYPSQLGAVFEDLNPRIELQDYWGRGEGIRLWASRSISGTDGLDSTPKA